MINLFFFTHRHRLTAAYHKKRNPFLKGDSTESSNPFGEEDEDEMAEEGEEDEDRYTKKTKDEKKKKKKGKAPNPTAAAAAEQEEENEFELPEWLTELPDDLEVGMKHLTSVYIAYDIFYDSFSLFY
jgi:hypothetical protein